MDGATGVSTVITAAGEVLSLSGTIFDTILGNPVLVFYMAVGFVGIGVGVVKMLKRAVR